MCEALAWFPGERAWQSGTADRRQIRKDERLEALKRWLVAHNSAGAITRQEAVSMVPPLFLDVQPHHAVLDLCAAPGSKTSQLLEHVHAPAAAAADDRGVDARAAEAATATVRDGFARAADVLPTHDGSPSTDEMAFAAFSAIMLAPPEYGGTRWCDVDAPGGRASRMLAPREHMPTALRELQDELCETAAGKRTLALYANHRLY